MIVSEWEQNETKHRQISLTDLLHHQEMKIRDTSLFQKQHLPHCQEKSKLADQPTPSLDRSDTPCPHTHTPSETGYGLNEEHYLDLK